MATLPPGTIVDLSEHASEALRFVPPDGDLVVVVHPGALHARWDAHTQVAQIVDGSLTWLGAVGEAMLVTLEGAPVDHGARAAVERCMMRGSRLWHVVRPGALLVPHAWHEPSSVYGGSDRRPWVVIGETDLGDAIAAPLNEAGNPKWWTPIVPRAALDFPGNLKDAQLELAHLWSFPADVVSVGEVGALGRAEIERAVHGYVG